MALKVKDRCGLLPREAETLLDVARLRILGEKRGLQRIIVEAHQLQIWFDDTWIEQFDSSELFNEHLRIIMELLPEQLQFLQDKYFGFKVPVFNEEPIAYTKKLLQRWG